ncbi:hypothetical protein J4471_02200 [Candidatus Woesearchaeota archaeon]|nr:hypothetical protein [Candidatus Woesearchaeota archaeon]
MKDPDKLKQEIILTIKKFNLPNYKDLDIEFEISNIEHDGHILRAIRRKIVEKLEFFCKIIENVIFPDASSFASFQESKSFDESERADLVKLYKKLMIYDRISLSLEIENDDKKSVKLINELFSEWKNIKPQLLTLVKTMTDSWNKDDEALEERYFG